MKNSICISSFLGAFFVLAFLIALQMLASLVLYELGFKFEAGDPVFSGLIMLFSNIIVIAALVRHNGFSYKNLFHENRSTVKSTILLLVFPILLTFVGSVFWLSDLTSLMLLFFPAHIDEYLMMSRFLSGGLVSIVVVCIIAPLMEELLFRGVMLRGFLKHYSEYTSIMLSAMLFSIAHLTLIQLPVTYILGTLLGWLYVRTKSLWPSILAHAIYNTCVMIFWSVSEEKIHQGSVTEFNSVGVTAIAIISSAIGFYMLRLLLVSKRG
ncbi:CPBP family intramembrane glutamic endopeptidase [Vibrio nigripulchritudo]|uniref:CPBP family intramembrane glutamic endopeptidase n=1 Tax=Vibrio nigripulchritudo TaxID=28173 RepID=UPI0005F9CE65|nr:type II CAAX endopeptidase family protein [Vibrio nigripulchritudo]KJY80864.1 hypothetical protein TW74_00785 [Vibrio nigripulchritudo]